MSRLESSTDCVLAFIQLVCMYATLSQHDFSTTTGRVYFRKLDRGGGGGGEPHIQEILGDNMKTHVAVYEEGLFDLRGG